MPCDSLARAGCHERNMSARLVFRNTEPEGCREMSGNVRAIPAADQRALDTVCLAKMIVSTSALRNNTRPLGVR